MTAKPIRVLVWSLGAHAVARVLPALVAANGVELAGLLSRDIDKASALGNEFNVPAFDSVETALSRDEIDAVYVASVTAAHVPFGLEVLGAGKHLWSEKPLAMTLDQLDELDTLARSNHKAVFETDMFLHHPQHLELSRLCADGEYGPVRSLTARFGFPHRSPTEFRYKASLGGGALADAGFYPVAAAIDLLTGPVALNDAVLSSQRGYEVDTDGIALITDATGTPGVLEWGFGRAYRSEIEAWTADAVIRAPRGFAKPAGFESVISVQKSDGSVDTKRIAAADPFVAMFEAYGARIGAATVGVDVPARQRAELISHIVQKWALHGREAVD